MVRTLLLEYSALGKNTTGNFNIAIGHSALSENTQGEKNTAIGHYSDAGTSGDNNVTIGYNADVSSSSSASNQIVIGKDATGKGNGYAVIGSGAITRLYANENAGATLYAAGLNLGNTAVTSTATELNIVDGNNAPSDITIEDADQIILNDGGNGGTMKQVAVTKLNTYLGSATKIDDLSDGKSGGTNFTRSLLIGPESTATLSADAQNNTGIGYKCFRCYDR